MSNPKESLQAKRSPNDSLATLVSTDLLRRIESNELTPGSRLPSERELMARYGVSRTVVREAISSLRSSGRVATQQGRGAFVLATTGLMVRKLPLNTEQATSRQTHLHLLEVRNAVEAEAAAIAARRRTDKEMNAIEQAQESLSIALDGGGNLRRKDVDFHLAIARATHNTYFEDVFAALLQLRADRPLRRSDSVQARKKRVQIIRAEHLQIVQAIARQDPDAARSAMQLHLSNSAHRAAALFDAASAADEAAVGEEDGDEH
ncbi:MAG: FadR/GntR family transcriptional regulator [Rhodocyclaceae bacterium]